MSTAVAQCFSRLWILFSRVSIGETARLQSDGPSENCFSGTEAFSAYITGPAGQSLSGLLSV